MSVGSRLDSAGALALARAVLSGDAATVMDLLGADTVLDVPRLPVAVGASGVTDALHESAEAYPYDVVELRHFNAVVGVEGSAHEIRSLLRVNDRDVLLPIAIADSVVNGRRLVRLYHSGRLITGVRTGRRPVFAVDPSADPTPTDEVHPAVGSYMAAIRSGDPEAVLNRFAPGGALDNGVRPVASPEDLRAVFTAMTRSGGVRLIRWNEIDDGRTVAFEYSGLALPGAPGAAPRTPPGGGIGLYTYATDGRIVSVRMYDDFDPDALIALGSKYAESDHST